MGGESGPKTRPMHPSWASSLLDQCQNAGVAVFFKQRGQWTWDTCVSKPHAYVSEADGRVADEEMALADGGSWAGVARREGPGRSCTRRPHLGRVSARADLYAASSVVGSSGRSTSLPFSNLAPARTSGTRCGALTARQRDLAASISL